MADKIVMPLDDFAGQELPFFQALQTPSGEMIRQATNLELQAEKARTEAGNRTQSLQTMLARATDLRRYGWAAWLIWIQVDPLLLKIARQQGLTLPDNLNPE